MADTVQTGHTRPKPDSGSSSPIGKKPRLEASSEGAVPPSSGTAKQKPAPVTSHKKSAKKEARKAKKKGLHLAPEPYSTEDVLWHDVASVLGKEAVEKAIEEETEWNSPFEFREEVELEVHSMSSNGACAIIVLSYYAPKFTVPLSGEALALAAAPRHNWVVVVPFSLPGEKIRARVYRSSRLHSVADLVSVVTPNTNIRDQSLVKCKYFGKCAGCQYQMIPYETQLDLKRTVVTKAYANFSGRTFL